MSVMKYKDASGNWVEATSFNQVVGVANTQEWKEIEVTKDSSGNYDCSAAGIDLLATENWILCAAGANVNDSNNQSFHAVASGKSQAVFVTPIIARLKGEDMTNQHNRIGIYTLNVDAYGYKGFGSDMFVHKAYAIAMESGVNTSQNFRVYDTYIRTDNTWDADAKLIYLA